jgi:hypothetical protein
MEKKNHFGAADPQKREKLQQVNVPDQNGPSRSARTESGKHRTGLGASV